MQRWEKRINGFRTLTFLLRKRTLRKEKPEEDSKYEGKAGIRFADGRRKSWGAKF